MTSTTSTARSKPAEDRLVRPLLRQTLARLNDLVVARRVLLDDANLSLPVVFQILLLLGAVLALDDLLLQAVRRVPPGGDDGAAAALFGTAMLVALVLDYPYSGAIAVSNASFKASSLLLLAGG